MSEAFEQAMVEARKQARSETIASLSGRPYALEYSEHAMLYKFTDLAPFTQNSEDWVAKLLRVRTTVQSDETFTDVEVYAVLATKTGQPSKRKPWLWISVPEELADVFPRN